MEVDQLATTPRAKTITLQLLDELLTPEAARDVGVRLWDGTLWPDDRPRLTTIVLNHPGAIRAMFASLNEVGLAEAYLYDDFDV
jgi:cyclopropane-fatty-acyl-phospholipid synthase